MIYLTDAVKGIIVVVAILGVTGLIAVVSYLIYRYTHPRLKNEKPSDEEILHEEMDRILKPIDDEEVAKEITNYHEDEE